MKQLVHALLLSILFMPQAMADSALQRFEGLYDQLLSRYWHEPVTINGIRTAVLDYTALWRDAAQPDSLYRRVLLALAEVQPARLGEREAEAFWINAYNFAAIRLVIAHYPVPTIRSFRISWSQHPWSKRVIQVRGDWYTLAGIEDDLLRRFKDPRILFALNCASVSCPDLRPHPYTASRLDAQLTDTLRGFLRNPSKGLRLRKSAGRLHLSWIFKKDRDHFPAGDHGLISFLTPYLEEETRNWLIANAVDTEFLEHDWALNDLALSRQ